MLLIILIISIIHFTLINPMEKMLTQLLVKTYPRPIDTCINQMSFKCLGMPSGHVETSVIFALLLVVFYNISPILAVIFIVLVGSQRILSKAHTINQVMVGMLLGFIYSILYAILNNPIYILLVCLSIGFVLILFITSIVEGKIYASVPSWVDPQLYYIITKKRTSFPLIIKMLSVCTPLIKQDLASFISWNQLEKKLDNIIDKIDVKKIDCIIGIKSGGAILSNYLSKKLNIPCYYVRVSSKCQHYKVQNTFVDLYKRVYGIKLHQFSVCEPIEADITGKNVLLIDEQIATGTTVQTVVDYLNSKAVSSTIIATLCDWRVIKNNIHAITPDDTGEKYNAYAWGFDN